MNYDDTHLGHENPLHPMHDKERELDIFDAIEDVRTHCSDETIEYIENALSWLKPALKDELTILRDVSEQTENSYFKNKLNALLNWL